MSIPMLILSALSTAEMEEIRQVKETCDRYESRMAPDADMGSVYCDCINATDMAWRAYVSRLSGEIEYALRCERVKDRLLTKYGF